jgi:hypothetical protein
MWVIKNHVLSIKVLSSIITSVPSHHHGEINGTIVNCNHHHHHRVHLHCDFNYFKILFKMLNYVILTKAIIAIATYRVKTQATEPPNEWKFLKIAFLYV